MQLVEDRAHGLAALENPRVDLADRILGSLRDFAFTELSFDFVPAGDDLTLRVQCAGKGRAVPQELDVTVNFHGFDDAVDLAVGAKLGLEPGRTEPRRQNR